MIKATFYGNFLFLPVLLIIFGCSGGKDPVNSDPFHALESSVQQTNNSNVLWGLWHISIDPTTLTAQIVPLRTSQFTCNVTQFMQPPSSPVHMISLSFPPGGDPANGYFIVDVSLKHPFPGLYMYNGFDVRGVFMSNGTLAGQYDSSAVRAGPEDSRLLNMDGYTRFWNSTEFTSYGTIFGYTKGKLGPPINPSATINPYKYFADGLEKEAAVESLDPSTRGIFKAGSTNTRRYMIQFKMSGGSVVFDFNYAVVASWEEPDKSYAPNYPSEAFSISANCAEAYHMVMTDAGSTAYYVNDTKKGGKFVFDLEIFDRQGAVKPAGVPGEISAIWLESNVLTSPVNVLGSAIIKPGSTSASSVFQVELTSLQLKSSGQVEFFATIESADPTTYEPQIPGGSSFAYPSAPLAAYFTFYGTISDKEPPPVDDWPTTPVLIDPNYEVYATRFAVDVNGIVHALYCDYNTIYWSYSTNKGNNWINKGAIATVTPGFQFGSSLAFSPNLQMDAAGNFVYAVFAESGSTCRVRGVRLDANNLDAGWSSSGTIWTMPGLYFFYGLAISALPDGNVMVVGGKYLPFALYYSYGQWTTLIAGISNPPNMYTNVDNGSIVYDYMRYTPCLVKDSKGDFYIALGGRFVDNFNANGTAPDYGNSLLTYVKGTNKWHILQTQVGIPTPTYWCNETRGLAIDSNDILHWVAVWQNNGGGDCGGAGRWTYGDWKMFYGYGPTTGDHTGWTFFDPINSNYHIIIPQSNPGCVFNSVWWNTSVGSVDGSSVVMIYQKARFVAEMWATRYNGSTWSEPVNIEGAALYADLPWGKMHPSGNFLITFTDFQTDGNTTIGSRLPYFVTWK